MLDDILLIGIVEAAVGSGLVVLAYLLARIGASLREKGRRMDDLEKRQAAAIKALRITARLIDEQTAAAHPDVRPGLRKIVDELLNGRTAKSP